MKVFFEREESDNQIIIKVKPYFLYSHAAFVIFVFLSQRYDNGFLVVLSTIFVALAIILTLVREVAMRNVNLEIKGAMKKEKSKVTTTKFSFLRPTVVSFPKSLLN